MISNIQIIILFIVLFVVDILYISMSRGYYGSYPTHIQGFDRKYRKYRNANNMVTAMESAILSFIILGASWLILLANKIKPSTRYLEILPFTVLYGLIVYGVFNTTLFVLTGKWDIYVSIIDTIWGVLLITTMALIYLTVLKKL